MSGKVEIRWQEEVLGREGLHDGFVVVNSLEEAWDALESIFKTGKPHPEVAQPEVVQAPRDVLAQLRVNDIRLVRALRQTLSEDFGFTREVVKQLIHEEVERQLEEVFQVGGFRSRIDALVDRSLSQKFIGGLTVQEVINQSTTRLVSKWIADNLELGRRNREGKVPE